MCYIITRDEIENFNPEFTVSLCLCQLGDKSLLLRRNPEKREGGKLGLPGGKVEGSESAKEAAIRELFEETGIKVAIDHSAKNYNVRYPELDFSVALFIIKMKSLPKISLRREEHSEYIWEDIKNLSKEDIVMGNWEILTNSID